MRVAGALLAAVVWVWAGPGSGATVSYVFGGDCAGGGCPTGASFNGTVNLDAAGFEAGQVVDPSLISDVRFTYGGTNTLGTAGPSLLQAVWGSAPGRLASLTYQASVAVAPETGFTVGIWMQGGGGLLGALTGSSRASLVGNCDSVLCDQPEFGGSYANYGAQGLLVPGPAPIPLPPALGLMLAGIAGLAALRLRRRPA